MLLETGFVLVATKEQFQFPVLNVMASYLYKSCKGRIWPWSICWFLFQGRVQFLFRIYTCVKKTKKRIKVLPILKTTFRANCDKLQSQYCMFFFPGKGLPLESQNLLTLSYPLLLLCELLVSCCNGLCPRLFWDIVLPWHSCMALQALFPICCKISSGLSPVETLSCCSNLLLIWYLPLFPSWWVLNMQEHLNL